MRNKTNIDWSIPREENLRRLTYESYLNMFGRCRSDHRDHKPYYKDKGITVCERWKESFDNFIEDMGICPELGFTLDRINNSENYSKENCRWASNFLQALNRETSRESKKGVCYHKRVEKWCAYIRLGKKLLHLGYADTETDAEKIRKAADIVIERLIDMEVIR